MASWDITTSGSSFNFDTEVGQYNACGQIDDNHFINAWADTGSDGFAQVFAVNTTTWAITTAGATLEYDTTQSTNKALIMVDSNHALVAWNDSSLDGRCQVLAINTSTWAVTTAAAPLEFETQILLGTPSFARVDTNHFLIMYRGTAQDGYVEILTVNTTTWAVTTAAARLEFDTVNCGTETALCQIDANHFLGINTGSGDDGFAEIFTVNTTTWAVTTAVARFEFDTRNCRYQNVFQIDDNHFFVLYSGSDADGYAQVLAVNTSTWAITTASAPLEWETSNATQLVALQYDSNHFVALYADVSNDGFAQAFEVNTSTFAISKVGTPLEFDTQIFQYSSICWIDSTHFVAFWQGGSLTGFSQVFEIEIPIPSADALKDVIMSGVVPFSRP